MTITQKQADKIVQNIEKELKDVFYDRSNIDLQKAKDIAVYCDKRYQDYDQNVDPVHFGYWFHLARKYKKAVNAAEEALKIANSY